MRAQQKQQSPPGDSRPNKGGDELQQQRHRGVGFDGDGQRLQRKDRASWRPQGDTNGGRGGRKTRGRWTVRQRWVGRPERSSPRHPREMEMKTGDLAPRLTLSSQLSPCFSLPLPSLHVEGPSGGLICPREPPLLRSTPRPSWEAHFSPLVWARSPWWSFSATSWTELEGAAWPHPAPCTLHPGSRKCASETSEG